MSSAPPIAHAFIVPDPSGLPTGGTLYNAALIAALQRAGASCRHFELGAAPHALATAGDVVWVDSLYLDAMPALRARSSGTRLHLLLHYLPSLVRCGGAITRADVSAGELRALELADAVLVPSRFMQETLAQLGFAQRPVLCVEPGVSPPAAAVRPAGNHDAAFVQAVMLCHVTEGKGVLPLLTALAERVRDGDRFALRIAGALDVEPSYVAACRALLPPGSALGARVHMLGALPHAQALGLLRGAGVLLSSSRMESYGMALAEARAAGVPILARQGGHAVAHVDPAAGGEWVADERALAERFLELVRAPAALAARQRKAAAGTRARSWDAAAAEVGAILGELILSR